MQPEPPQQPQAQQPQAQQPQAQQPQAQQPQVQQPQAQAQHAQGSAPPQGVAQPQSPQPGWGMRRRPVARAPREAWERPVRVEPVPGTPYGLVVYGNPPVTSGPAIGALTAGVAALTVALVVTCFGLAGASDGWGPLVAGAFGVLATVLGGGGIGLGVVGLRRTRTRTRGPGAAATGTMQVRGRGLALSGLICGAIAVVLTAGALALSLLIALA